MYRAFSPHLVVISYFSFSFELFLWSKFSLFVLHCIVYCPKNIKVNNNTFLYKLVFFVGTIVVAIRAVLAVRVDMGTLCMFSDFYRAVDMQLQNVSL